MGRPAICAVNTQGTLFEQTGATSPMATPYGGAHNAGSRYDDRRHLRVHRQFRGEIFAVNTQGTV